MYFHVNDGIFYGRPLEEGQKVAHCQTSEYASRAVTLLNSAIRENRAGHYTKSARLNARAENVPTFTWTGVFNHILNG